MLLKPQNVTICKGNIYTDIIYSACYQNVLVIFLRIISIIFKNVTNWHLY